MGTLVICVSAVFSLVACSSDGASPGAGPADAAPSDSSENAVVLCDTFRALLVLDEEMARESGDIQQLVADGEIERASDALLGVADEVSSFYETLRAAVPDSYRSDVEVVSEISTDAFRILAANPVDGPNSVEFQAYEIPPEAEASITALEELSMGECGIDISTP